MLLRYGKSSKFTERRESTKPIKISSPAYSSVFKDILDEKKNERESKETSSKPQVRESNRLQARHKST